MKRVSIGAGVLSAVLAGCPAGVPGGGGGLGGLGGGGGGGELGGECRGDFGSGAAAQKLEAFLGATSTFVSTAAELEGSIVRSCRTMGEKLGVPAADMEPSGDEPVVRSACAPVAAKLQAELADLRAQANLQVTIAATPPRCEVSMDAYASCAAECSAEYEPGQVDVQCEGGEIVGRCSGECTGTCSVEVSGECAGECHGTCEGGCQGTCQGTCEGTCSAQGTGGQCNGRCEGTCHGTCSANCEGSCQGECWVSGQASCSGECRGGCSVDYEEPRCTGTVRPPRLEAECEASCDARLNAEATCKPGRAELVVRGDVSGNIEERVNNLRAAITEAWPEFMAAAAKLERLAASGERMVRTAGDVPGAVATLGLQAANCASQAAAMIPRAMASVTVSVEVSVSVSAAASGRAG